ncbi:hypothetical protein [Salipiger mucosus]|uniref:Uncharacterized protein n=1 Tax=Salipiger mucosus DSM 16094 TaxID=1123237 RepID=S9RS04_9RHOB|nr:hypothetical protein [Salipiger mucosus]EPX76749.1 hypothetical protein Salmuc_04634 [Salipiger mucosus DSM 16094]
MSDLRFMCAAAVLAMSWATAALAQNYEWATREKTGRVDQNNDIYPSSVYLAFGYEAEIRLGHFFSEPVISTRFKYELDPYNSQVTLPAFDPGDDRYETRRLADLPSEAWEKARLYDVDLILSLSTSHPDYPDVVIHTDVGAPGPGDGQTWSFNVPGSPDWDELFYTGMGFANWTGDFEAHYDPVPEEAAKEIYMSGLQLDDIRIYRSGISLYHLHDWYSRMSEQPKISALKRASFRVARAIGMSYGYDEDLILKMDDGEQRLRNSGMSMFDQERRLRDEWEARLKRLTNLPDKLRIGSNHGPYRQALKDAERILDNADVRVDGFSPLDINPASLPRGRPGKFSGNYRVAEFEEDGGDENWVVDSEGSRVRELEYGEVLVNERYVAGIDRCKMTIVEPSTGRELLDKQFRCTNEIDVWKMIDFEGGREVDTLYINVPKKMGRRVQKANCDQPEMTEFAADRFRMTPDLKIERAGTSTVDIVTAPGGGCIDFHLTRE